MRWLFALFIASLIALLWAAIAVARHIRRDARERRAGTTAMKSAVVKSSEAATIVDAPDDGGRAG